MKVTVEESPKNKKKYPYIGIYNGIIVLFTQKCTGTLIGHSDNYFNIYGKDDVGYYTDNWKEDVFITYDGKVILEN